MYNSNSIHSAFDVERVREQLEALTISNDHGDQAQLVINP